MKKNGGTCKEGYWNLTLQLNVYQMSLTWRQQPKAEHSREFLGELDLHPLNLPTSVKIEEGACLIFEQYEDSSNGRKVKTMDQPELPVKIQIFMGKCMPQKKAVPQPSLRYPDLPGVRDPFGGRSWGPFWRQELGKYHKK